MQGTRGLRQPRATGGTRERSSAGSQGRSWSSRCLRPTATANAASRRDRNLRTRVPLLACKRVRHTWGGERPPPSRNWPFTQTSTTTSWVAVKSTVGCGVAVAHAIDHLAADDVHRRAHRFARLFVDDETRSTFRRSPLTRVHTSTARLPGVVVESEGHRLG